MVFGQFKYALIPLSLAKKPADWLLDDESEHYFDTDILDMPEELVNVVFSQYQASYENVDETPRPKLIQDADGLFKYNRWILFYEDNDPNQTVICFCLYKTTDFGLKSTLGGSDGSKAGKRCMLTFKTTAFNTDGVYGEISGPLERCIIHDVPVVPIEKTKKLLNELGKTGIEECDDNHYSRIIGSLGSIEKIMVGKPHIRE